VPEDGEAVVKEPDVKSIVPKSSSGSLNFCGRASRRGQWRSEPRLSEHDGSED
jgi:hypothetical protein